MSSAKDRPVGVKDTFLFDTQRASIIRYSDRGLLRKIPSFVSGILMDHSVYRNGPVNGCQPVAACELFVQMVVQVSSFHQFKVEETGAAGIRVLTAAREISMGGLQGGFHIVNKAFVFTEMGSQVNQVASFEGGFPYTEGALFFPEFSQEPPLVKAGKLSARPLEFLLGQFET